MAAQPASELNQEQNDRRIEQAGNSENVVDLQNKQKVINEFLTDHTDEYLALELERKAINENIKAILDDVEAAGHDRKAFKDGIKLRKMEQDKRVKYELTRENMKRAFGFDGAQVDMFDSGEPTPPSDEEQLEQARQALEEAQAFDTAEIDDDDGPTYATDTSQLADDDQEDDDGEPDESIQTRSGIMNVTAPD